MVKLLFVLMNEYRLWALPQALAALERRYPGAVEGRVYSVREINADAGLERALLADGAAADMAFLASHGSIQNLYCFSRLWEALEGRPVYFTSTMGDELAELLPRLGLEPALYAALDSYYQAGSPADLEGLVLCALNGRFGGDYPLSPPSPPRGQGVYTLEGFLPPEREAGYRTRMAAETRPVIGVLIHDHYARTGNLEHVTPCCGPFRPGGASHTPCPTPSPPTTGRSRASSTGWSGSTAGRTAPPFRGRWWCPTASA